MDKIIKKKDLDAFKEKGNRLLFADSVKIAVQAGTCGIASGAQEIFDFLSGQVSSGKFVLSRTGCIGLCKREPMVNVSVPGSVTVVYADMTKKLTEELLKSWIKGETPVKNSLMTLDDALYANPLKDLKLPSGHAKYRDIPFYKKQEKIALRNSGFINPHNLSEYIARGGFYTLFDVLNGQDSDKIIDEIETSGLRGRGGGGFPTGRKWRSCRNAKGDKKYVICNADEGDPGAYMDRTVLEGDPFSVIEGLAIGGYAIGANEGYVYVRAEYPLAVETLKQAIETARNHGLLGKNIFGTDFSFDIRINRGGGAFVCGESTALMASIEGNVGEPRTKHIHTVESGLWEKPTTLNNVETWANVPAVVNMGGSEFRKIGTKGSAGTKVFSVVGDIVNSGLVEVPMGMTLKELVFGVGGGIPGNRKLKAVQSGGPSGGCIPADKADIPIDFDELVKVGSMMGSGGLIIMDEDTCMVDVARYFLSFLVDESCGKCTPCREGTYQLKQILDRITRGEGKPGDLELIEEIAQVTKDCSLCALGKSAPNPILSTLTYFRDEYKAHIEKKKCPAGVCKALITYTIIPEACTACGKCLKSCPASAIEGGKKVAHRIIPEKCTKCGICFDVCAFDAVKKV
ncbi:MAG: 4Fe-4S binding protein [Spirochaetales bacterium]|nr:4Fe-4S binding protein [Spirochaetales bacterium]